MSGDEDRAVVVFRLSKAEVSKVGQVYVGRAVITVQLPDPKLWDVIEKKIDGLSVNIRADMVEELSKVLQEDNKFLEEDLKKANSEIVRLRGELALAAHYNDR